MSSRPTVRSALALGLFAQRRQAVQALKRHSWIAAHFTCSVPSQSPWTYDDLGEQKTLPSEDVVRALLGKIERGEVKCGAGRLEPRANNVQLGLQGHYERPGAFAFRVGDIVVHRIDGHIGVVAERFEMCEHSDAALAASALAGMRLQQPFYTILVHGSGQGLAQGYICHGAQSLHRRWNPSLDGGPPHPVQHVGMRWLFGKLNLLLARYDPLYELVEDQELVTAEWDTLA